jgi:hypothetical protein
MSYSLVRRHIILRDIVIRSSHFLMFTKKILACCCEFRVIKMLFQNPVEGGGREDGILYLGTEDSAVFPLRKEFLCLLLWYSCGKITNR